MTTKALLAATLLALVPGFAMAEGCGHATKDQTASSCKDGMIWDEGKGMCVVQPSS